MSRNPRNARASFTTSGINPRMYSQQQRNPNSYNNRASESANWRGDTNHQVVNEINFDDPYDASKIEDLRLMMEKVLKITCDLTEKVCDLTEKVDKTDNILGELVEKVDKNENKRQEIHLVHSYTTPSPFGPPSVAMPKNM